jgi:extradiol dioxygenase family protein
VRPIFHLSFPVRDLQESVDFYVTRLGAQIGRRSDMGADAFVFGAQLTLQNDPASLIDPMPRTRHFGATLPWDEWEALAARLVDSVQIVEPPTLSYVGEPIEQGKMMIVDPSGNLIEIKAYRHPVEVLGPLAAE